jgi:hypothetical protein
MAVEDAFFSEGILAGSRVATPGGWRAVESLSPGDIVLTFDHGAQPLQEVHHVSMALPVGEWPVVHWPLQLPQGVLANHDTLRVLPGQLILIESDIAETMFGDPFALIPARALEPWRGIMPCPPHLSETAYLPVFDKEQLVYVNGGVLMHCPAMATQDYMRPGPEIGQYVPLSLASARDLVAAMMAEDVGAALDLAAPKGSQAALGRATP